MLRIKKRTTAACCFAVLAACHNTTPHVVAEHYYQPLIECAIKVVASDHDKYVGGKYPVHFVLPSGRQLEGGSQGDIRKDMKWVRSTRPYDYVEISSKELENALTMCHRVYLDDATTATEVASIEAEYLSGLALATRGLEPEYEGEYEYR